MPDHPQSSLTEPAEAFRETFHYWIEDPEHHDATRRFGKLLEQLVGEAQIVVRNRASTRRTARGSRRRSGLCSSTSPTSSRWWPTSPRTSARRCPSTRCG